jgi:hypothetical protein
MIEQFIEIIGVLVLPLMMLTLVIGENPIYRISERLLVAVTLGYALALSIYTVLEKCWIPMIGGKWIYIIPFILGFLLYTQLSGKYSWLIRYPVSVMTGTNIGLLMRGEVQAGFLEQLMSTTTLLFTTQDAIKNFSNLIFFIGTVTSISYFIFSRRFDVGPMRHVRGIGRYFLLIALGSAFGMTAASRQNMLIGRLSLLFTNDLKWISVGVIVILSVLLAFLWKAGYVKKE